MKIKNNTKRCYRSELEILRDMLDVIYRSTTRDGVRKTHLLYYANLNTRQLEKYLERMRECDLILVDDSGRLHITRKGVTVLTLMNKLMHLLDQTYEKRLVDEIRRATLRTLASLGFRVQSPAFRYGISGLQHYFDALVEFEGREVMLHFSLHNKDDPLMELAFFSISVLDCDGRGILITDKKFPVSNSLTRVGERIYIIKVDVDNPSNAKYLLSSEILRLLGTQP